MRSGDTKDGKRLSYDHQNTSHLPEGLESSVRGYSQPQAQSRVVSTRGTHPATPIDVPSKNYATINATGNSHVVAGDMHNHYYYQAPMLSAYDFPPGVPIEDATLQTLVSHMSSMSAVLQSLSASRGLSSGFQDQQFGTQPAAHGHSTPKDVDEWTNHTDDESAQQRGGDLIGLDGDNNEDADLFELDDVDAALSSSSSSSGGVAFIAETRCPSPVRKHLDLSRKATELGLTGEFPATPDYGETTTPMLAFFASDDSPHETQAGGAQFYHIAALDHFRKQALQCRFLGPLDMRSAFDHVHLTSWLTHGVPWTHCRPDTLDDTLTYIVVQRAVQVAALAGLFYSDTNGAVEFKRPGHLASWLWDPWSKATSLAPLAKVVSDDDSMVAVTSEAG